MHRWPCYLINPGGFNFIQITKCNSKISTNWYFNGISIFKEINLISVKCFKLSDAHIRWEVGPGLLTNFNHNSNSVDILFCCNFIYGHNIAINFCTCHYSTAVVSCAKFCGDFLVRIWMREKRNPQRIWIVMENRLWNASLSHNWFKLLSPIVAII